MPLSKISMDYYEDLIKKNPDKDPKVLAEGIKHFHREGNRTQFLPRVDELEYAGRQKLALEQTQAEQQKAIPDNSSDFVTGVRRGIEQTQAMLHGGGALAGRLMKSVGMEDMGQSVMDWGIEGYRRNMKEAEQYKAKHSFKDVYTGKAGFGGAIDWAQGTLGELVPTMAEAAIGALVGTLAAPGAGSIAGAFASKTVLKQTINKMTREIIESGVEGVAEDQIRKQVTRQALKSLGGKVGLGAAVLPIEAGGMYAELLESHGVDAPGTALLFGAAATAMEYMGGNSRLIDNLVDAVAKGNGGMIKRTAKEILKGIPEEAAQEGAQELMGILNTVVNTDEKLLTADNIEQLVEAAAAGAVGGGAGAVVSGVMSKKAPEKNEKGGVGDKAGVSDAEKVILDPDEYGKSPEEVLMGDFLSQDDEVMVASEFSDEELNAAESKVADTGKPAAKPQEAAPTDVLDQEPANILDLDAEAQAGRVTTLEDAVREVSGETPAQAMPQAEPATTEAQQAQVEPGMIVSWEDPNGNKKAGTVEKLSGGVAVVKGEDGKTYRPKIEALSVAEEKKAPEESTSQNKNNALSDDDETAFVMTEDGRKGPEQEDLSKYKKSLETFQAKFDEYTSKPDFDEDSALRMADVLAKKKAVIELVESGVPFEEAMDKINPISKGTGNKTQLGNAIAGLQTTKGDVQLKDLRPEQYKSVWQDHVEHLVDKIKKQKKQEQTPASLGQTVTADETIEGTQKAEQQVQILENKEIQEDTTRELPQTDTAKIKPGQRVTFKGKGGVDLTGTVTEVKASSAKVKTDDGKTFMPNIAKLRAAEEPSVSRAKGVADHAKPEMSQHEAKEPGEMTGGIERIDTGESQAQTTLQDPGSSQETKTVSRKNARIEKIRTDRSGTYKYGAYVWGVDDQDRQIEGSVKRGWFKTLAEAEQFLKDHQYEGAADVSFWVNNNSPAYGGMDANGFSVKQGDDGKITLSHEDKYFRPQTFPSFRELDRYGWGELDNWEVLRDKFASQVDLDKKHLGSMQWGDLKAEGMSAGVFRVGMTKDALIDALEEYYASGRDKATAIQDSSPTDIGPDATEEPASTTNDGGDSGLPNLEVSGQRKSMPNNEGLWYSVHKNGKGFTVTIGSQKTTLVANVYGHGDTAEAAYMRAVEQLKPELRPSEGHGKDSVNSASENIKKDTLEADTDKAYTEQKPKESAAETKQEKEGTNAESPDAGRGSLQAGTDQNAKGGDAGKSAKDVQGFDQDRGTSGDAGNTGGVADRGVQDSGKADPGGNVSGRKRGQKSSETGAKGGDDAQAGVGNSPGVTPGILRRRGPATDYHIRPDVADREGGWKKAAENNLNAIELCKKISSEKRNATPEEQEILSRYVGWGASDLANNMFPGYASLRRVSLDWANNDWKPLVKRLVDLMTPEEIKTAARSTQYAHYTSNAVISSIYKALGRLGFNGGKILEPGAGIGKFIGLMPESMRKDTIYTGIEMDHISAGIAGLLYPNQNILHADFTQQALPANFFDAAIGNPPFGGIKILADPEYKKHRFSLHNYFFAKSIDRVRPGGLLVFVTSRYTMDSANDRARQYFADRADLLGAIRLPQTAFKQNAGTEVVTDVIFLKKRDPDTDNAGESWSGQETVATSDGNEALINEYFARHPEMVLGKHSTAGSMYSKNEYTVMPDEGVDIETAFDRAIENLPKDIYSKTTKSQQKKNDPKVIIERDFNPKNKKEGGLYLSDSGEVMRVDFGSGVPVDSIRKLGGKEKAMLKSYVGLRDALKLSHKAQLEDGDWESALKNLQKEYRKFIKDHGRILEYKAVKRKIEQEDGTVIEAETQQIIKEKVLGIDVEYSLVAALEKIGSDGSISESPILHGRTIMRPTTPEIKTIPDALAVSLDTMGRLDLDHVAELIGKPKDEVIGALGDLIYKDHATGEWSLADEYLSGNVVKKLEEAKAAAKINPELERNVAALETVQPDPLPHDKITVVMGANWVPVKYYNDFARETLEIRDGKVSYNHASNSWTVSGNFTAHGLRGSTSQWGTQDRGPNEIMESVLNNATIKITKSYTDESGRKITEVDASGTTAANEIANKMRQRFASWVWEQSDRADDVRDIYNRRFNNIAPRRFDGSHLTLPGVSLHFNMYDHQKRAIWRNIQSGNTYLAHAVGAGKTFTMIAAGMEMRRLGMVKKPMYVVPKHMLGQFAREFQELYPMAQVMVADEENFHTSNRRRFMAQATLNDPDAIVITHSSFGLIGAKKETIEPVKEEFLAQLQMALDDMVEDRESPMKIKRMEKRIEQAEQRFDSLIAKGDNAVTFEELGVDYLFVDEAHEFRKLDFSTNRQVKGIDSNGSRRAIDLYIKILWLEKMNPGRSHTFASGTPITNTLGELYTLMRFFDRGEMEQEGLDYFDSWANMFGQTAVGYEMNAAGRYEQVERFSKFVNIPELMSRVRMFMDVLTSNQLGVRVKRPEIRGGAPEIVLSAASEALKKYQTQSLQPRIESSKKWKPTPTQPGNPDPIINIITDGRLASIDLRFVVPGAKNDPTSKLNRYIDGIIDAYKEARDNEYLDETGTAKSPVKGGAQVCFFNVGFGKMVSQNRGFDSKAWVNKRLKEAGIPMSEVAWIEDYDTASKKNSLFREMKNGGKKILFGSAKKMGTGMNIQNRLTHLHYLDAPWYPADVEQPDGRIIRQGNQNKEVTIKRYATKGSYDATMWQMVSRKSRFIEQAFSGDKNLRQMEDISETSQYEMAAALASGDERVVQLVGLKADIDRLSKLETAHVENQYSLRKDKRDRENRIYEAEKRLDSLNAVRAVIPEYVREVSGKVGKKTFDNRKDFGDALAERFKTSIHGSLGEHTIGEINGIKIAARVTKGIGDHIQSSMRLYPLADIHIPTDILYWEGKDVPEGAGLISRLVNTINRIPGEIASTQASIRDMNDEIGRINKRIGAPFEYKAELNEKVAEAARIEQELLAEEAASKETKTEDSGPADTSTALDLGDGEALQFSAEKDPAPTPLTRKDLEALPMVREVTGKDGDYTLHFGRGISIPLKSIKLKGKDKFLFTPEGDRLVKRGWYDGKGITITQYGDGHTAAHEIFHFAEDVGLIDSKDKIALNREAERLAGKAIPLGEKAEARARLVEKLLRQRPAQRDSALGRIVQKLQDFADALVNIFRRTVRGVVRDFEKGGFAEGRPGQQQGAEAFSDMPITDTPEFKKWFGDSKVVDENGEPLVVYHGTVADFDAFSDDKQKIHGFYFTDSPDVAHYATGTVDPEWAPEKAKILPVYLKMEKPLIVDMKEGHVPNRIDELLEDVKRKGHDGIIAKNASMPFASGTEYIVFNPTKIKSAIANRGTFDPNNPDIRYSAEKDPATTAGEAITENMEGFAATFLKLKKEIFAPIGSRSDTTWANRMLSLLSHHSQKVPALKACFDAAINKQDNKRALERAMLYQDGVPLFAPMNTLKKKDAAVYERLKGYLLHRDLNRIGFRVREEIVELPTENGPTPSPRFVVYSETGKTFPETFKTENAAWAWAIEKEVSEYGKNFRLRVRHVPPESGDKGGWRVFDHQDRQYGDTFSTEHLARQFSEREQAGMKISDVELESLKNFRIIGHRMHNQLREGIEEMIRIYEARGERMPEVVEYKDGKKLVVDIRRALAEMGDLRGSYFPRLRREGGISLYATKPGENPRLEFFDTKAFAAANKLKWEKKGYHVVLDKHSRLPEDVYQEYGSLTNLQALTTHALEKGLSRDKDRAKSLNEVGIHSEIRKNRDGSEQLWLYGSFKMQHFDLMTSLGGKVKDREKVGANSKSWAPGFRFENLKEGEAQKLLETITNQVLATERLALDMDLAMAQSFVQQLADTIRERGSRSRMISRGSEVGKDVALGFEEDPVIAVVRAASGVAGGEAKRHMATAMVKAITGTGVSWDQYQAQVLEGGGTPDYADFRNLVNKSRIDPATQGSAYKEAMALMKDMTRNEEKADRIIGTLKGLAVFKYLAGNIASPAVNLTNLVAAVPATMNGYGKIPLKDTLRHVGKGMANYGHYRLRKGKGLSAEEIAFFDDIEARGWTDAQMNQEAFQVLQSKLGNAWSEMIRKSMVPFSLSEQMNRAATLHAAYFGMKDVHSKTGEFLGEKQAWDGEKALEMAKEISDKAHGTYGKANRPFWARGDNPAAQLAQMAYVFKTFSHNYLLTMYDLGVKTPGGKKAAAWMAFAPVMFGTSASVGASAVIKAVGIVLGSDDPEEDFYRIMAKQFGPTAERAARFGVLGMTPSGLSLKGSLEIGLADLPTDLNSLIGAPGNVIQDLAFGMQDVWRGDTWKGAERIAPRALASPMKAWREYSEGLTTRSNAPVFFGDEPARATIVDAIIRALSFTPSRITRMRDIQWSEKKREQKARDERSAIHRRIKRFYLLPERQRDVAKWAEIMEDIRAHNDWSAKHHMRPITYSVIRANLRRNFKASRQEASREDL